MRMTDMQEILKRLNKVEDRLDFVIKLNHELEKQNKGLREAFQNHIRIGETCPHVLV